MLASLGAVAASHVIGRTEMLAAPADPFGMSWAKRKLAHGSVYPGIRPALAPRAQQERRKGGRIIVERRVMGSIPDVGEGDTHSVRGGTLIVPRYMFRIRSDLGYT